jgi:RHS repeat-associated protein
VVFGVETGIRVSIDPNGNMTGDGTKTYQWDAENRLVAVLQGATTLASFVYDGSGKRASKTAGGVTHTYVYDQRNFIEERISSGQTLNYVQGPGIDRPLAQRDQAAVVSYYLADHLGSITQATNSGGAVTFTREYDPWGNLLQGSATAGFAFTAREWDPEITLYYYRARYYNPVLGRFLSEDRGAGNGRSPFSYVSNNPLSRVDPSGLVDLNLFSKDADYTFWKAADLYLSPEGIVTVAGHGNYTGMVDEHGWVPGTPYENSVSLASRWLTPEKLADRIKPLSKGKCCVYLLSCDVGSGDFAQRVADLLGMDVWAPTTKILFDPDWYMVASPDWPVGKTWGVQAPGHLQLFPHKK